MAVLGCGWEGREASEDESAAGAILHRLYAKGAQLDERARRVASSYLARPEKSLRQNSAARRLKRSATKRTSTSASRRTPCRSCPDSKEGPSWADGSRSLALGPSGARGRGSRYSPKIFLTGARRAITLRLGKAD